MDQEFQDKVQGKIKYEPSGKCSELLMRNMASYWQLWLLHDEKNIDANSNSH